MLRSDISKFANAMRGLLGLDSLLPGMGSMTSRLRRAPRRPTGAALRNPTDPFQAQRIQAAADKRQRKASKLQANTYTSLIRNNAHAERGHPQGGYAKSLNPLFVNR